MIKKTKKQFIKEKIKKIYDDLYEGMEETFEMYGIKLPKNPQIEHRAAILKFRDEHMIQLEDRRTKLSLKEKIIYNLSGKYPVEMRIEEEIIKTCNAAIQAIDLLIEKIKVDNRNGNNVSDNKATQEIAEEEKAAAQRREEERKAAAQRRAEADERHEAYLKKLKEELYTEEKPSAERREEYTIDMLISNLEKCANSEEMEKEISKFKRINQDVKIKSEQITIKSTSKSIIAKVIASLLKNKLVTNSQVIDYVRTYGDTSLYDMILVEIEPEVFKKGKTIDEKYARDVSALINARAEDKKRE